MTRGSLSFGRMHSRSCAVRARLLAGNRSPLATALITLSLACSTVPREAMAQSSSDADAVDRESVQRDEAQSDEPSAIEEVIVYGRARQLYRVGESLTGKLPLEPLEASQSVTAISNELIRDQGARDARDLYRNISGVSFFSYAGVTARGFRQQEIFYDGLRGDPLVSFSVPQLFNIEQVDYLKGPAGMLYGPGAPGGLFNYNTKKPTQEFEAELRGILGNFSRQGLSGEVSGPIVDDKTRARIGVFFEDRDLFTFNAENETAIYDLGLARDFGSNTLTLQYTRYDQELPGARFRGAPVDDDGNFLSDYRWSHNEPVDGMELETDYFNARIDGGDDRLQWNASARYISAKETQQWHSPAVAFLALPTVPSDEIVRTYVDQDREREILSAGANLIWTQDFGAVRTRILAGFDAYTEDLDFRNGFANAAVLGGPVPALSYLNPIYGVADPSSYPIVSTFQDTRQDRAGAYLLGEFTVDRWILTAGLRYDEFNDELDFVDQDGVETRDEEFDDNDTSLRFGAVYRLRDDVSLYAQWSESFVPQSTDSQTEAAGGPFDPTRGEMIEAGLKTELYDGAIQSSIVVYQITQENILQPVPNFENPLENAFAPIGEVQSEGIEIDVTADITSDWVVTVSYAYNETEITEGLVGEGNGVNALEGEFFNAPQNQFGLWTRYQWPSLDTAAAFGLDYVDERIGFGGQRVPAYEVFDASLFWEPGAWKVMFRMDNVFEEEYSASGFFDVTTAVPAAFGPTLGRYNFPGTPRTCFVEVSRTW